jgi:2-polyprenyl-3-methyl-5-hydroxy-6-metoxy-1,4-benzoquinol methylase
MLLEAWKQLVDANAAQVRRLSEYGEPADYWADGFAGQIVSMDNVSQSMTQLFSLADANQTWLDIGAGYGRVTLPLSRHVRRITALDPSPGLTQCLRVHIADHGIENIDVLEPQDWPPAISPGVHDVCLALNVVNFVAEIGPFLDAMEQHARDRCVIVATELGTAWQPVEPVFAALHGERFIRQPALQEILALLCARRRRFDVVTSSDQPPWVREPETLDAAHMRVRSHYFARNGSAKDIRLRELLDEYFGLGDGRVAMPPSMGRFVATITWTPPR